MTTHGLTLPSWECLCHAKLYPPTTRNIAAHKRWHRRKARETAALIAWNKQGRGLGEDAEVLILCANCKKIGPRARAHTCVDCASKLTCAKCGKHRKLRAKGICGPCYKGQA